MKALVTYLNFDGNCKEAMTFYGKCLNAELFLMPFEAPSDRTMHANLSRGGASILMASDTMPGCPFLPGNNFSVSVHCESMPEIQQLFGAIAEGGKVTMPLQDVFWGAHFGMLTDRFGVNWMFNYELPKPAQT
ncbi:MAG: VOC family protein [Bryobacteraceae bacterium]